MRTAGRKDINKLDHVVNKNLKTNKDQSNEAIDNELTFDTSNFNLSTGANNPLPVVTVSLQGGKKHRATTVSGITCLWDSGATGSMINIKHTKHYECKIGLIKYSIVLTLVCTVQLMMSKYLFACRDFLVAR